MDDPKAPRRHPMLQRQLKRHGLDRASVPAEWSDVLDAIDRSYFEHDESRYLLERSLEISSSEMQTLNNALKTERGRLLAELEIAKNLQTSIVPPDLRNERFEIAGRMLPATEVGGDYYEVIPVEGGTWVAMGDVAGHGLRAAVIVTMVQSMTLALIRRDPTMSPGDMLVTLNWALHENVFRRMKLDNHTTMSLLFCRDDGQVTYAGAHEVMLVLRTGANACEEVDTVGCWLGPRSDIRAVTTDRVLQLAAGDLLVLYTDGVTESMGPAREQYGLERLGAIVVEHRDATSATLCERTVERVRDWAVTQDDDISILYCRYLGAS